MNYKRIIAVGDVHGQYDKLVDLWKKLNFVDGEDLVIFLGDYIDRGAKSVDCLKFVKNLVESNTTVVALKGNHEDFMSRYFVTHSIDEKESRDIWLAPSNGGNVTLKQLQELSIEEYSELLKFVDNLPIYYDKVDGYFFVHAGINPQFDIYNQNFENYMWVREEFLFGYEGDLTFVVGHTPVQYIESMNATTPVVLENNIIMVDTGAAFGQKISAVDVLSRKVLQSF